MFINFSDIPGHQKIFLDYLYNFNNVTDFYNSNFNNKDEYLKKFKAVSESQNNRRTDLNEILIDQYKNFNPSKKTTENINSLKEDRTLAVVTGQQLGIIGGPLYTFYKIITAIKLARHLSERYDDYKFVPVFWLEGDDHDFDEVRSINFINENNSLTKVSYIDEIPDEEDRGSVGQLKITDSINSFFQEIDKSLRDTEFKADLINKLKNIYSAGKTFKESFKELIFWLFDEEGLIIFDPQDLKVKNLLKPIFKKEINNFRRHSEKLVSVSARLEELYHTQVKVRPVNLFYSNNDGRYVIEPVENEFRLKRKRIKFTKEELINRIETEPENFSPNVLLRPICQDYILPTAFYVGGPSEIAYFAQVNPLYNFFGITHPVIYPRSSVTILEKNINSIIDKYNLEINEVFEDPEKLKERVLKSISDLVLDDLFNSSQNQIEIAFDQLKEKLFEFDKTISDASTKYKQKIFHYLDELKEKALESQKKKYEITLRQLDKVSNSVFPNSNLQERELNFIYFAHKYGLDVLKRILNEIEINKFKHQVIAL